MRAPGFVGRNLFDAKALGWGDFSVAAGGWRSKGGAERPEMGLGSFGISAFWGERLALMVKIDESDSEESRLKAGCSRDWLPHISDMLILSYYAGEGELG
jgi:hypothetical protein